MHPGKIVRCEQGKPNHLIREKPASDITKTGRESAWSREVPRNLMK
jgi:hypothetical protein